MRWTAQASVFTKFTFPVIILLHNTPKKFCKFKMTEYFIRSGVLKHWNMHRGGNIWECSTICKGQFGIWVWHVTCFENRALLSYRAPDSSNFLPTFRDNLSIPSSGVKKPHFCPQTSERNYQYSQSNNLEGSNFHLLRGASLKSRTVAMLRVLKVSSGPRSSVVLEDWQRQMLHISRVPISIPGVSICSPRCFHFSDNTSDYYLYYQQTTALHNFHIKHFKNT